MQLPASGRTEQTTLLEELGSKLCDELAGILEPLIVIMVERIGSIGALFPVFQPHPEPCQTGPGGPAWSGRASGCWLRTLHESG